VAVGIDDRMIDLLTHCCRTEVGSGHSLSLRAIAVTEIGRAPSSPAGLAGVNMHVDDGRRLRDPIFTAFGRRMLSSTVMLISGPTGVRSPV
jgi:hypothetical protein